MTVTISAAKINAVLNGGGISVSTGNPVAREYVDREPYTGSYTITPGMEAQTLATDGLRMTGNVTIEAIPQNYGLITWNGSFLTIS